MYNIGWARSVAKSHYSRYARASYLVLVSTHFSMDHVARWLAKSHNDLESRNLWSFWKLFIEVLERELAQRVVPPTKQVFSKQNRSVLSDVFWGKDEWCPDWLLTSWEWWREHEEQFFKAPPRGALSPTEIQAEPGQFDFGKED